MAVKKLTDKQRRALAKGRRKLRKIRAVARARGVSMKTVTRSAKYMAEVNGTATPRKQRKSKVGTRPVRHLLKKAAFIVPKLLQRWF